MCPGSSIEAHQRIIQHVREFGFQTHTLSGSGPTVIGATGRVVSDELVEQVRGLPGVDQVRRSEKPYMLAQRDARPNGSAIQVGDVVIGGGETVVMAGTCVIENWETTISCARSVKASGAMMLRGGAFKPRTSPYSFQGLGEEGLKILARAGQETGLPVVTEVMEPEQVDLVAEHADMLQIGARNMSNFPLLRRVASTRKPILLKRGYSATINELLMSAEYILAGGNDHVVLCERGIRAFDTATRFTLDLTAVPLLNELTHLPVIVDPSHGTGIRSMIQPMSLAAVAAGAQGLIVEVHPNPDGALCDGDQSITPDTFDQIMTMTREISQVLNRARQGSDRLKVVA